VFFLRDRETGTVWQHRDGRAIHGPLAKRQLEMVPLLQIDWGAWFDGHPDAVVLSTHTAFSDRYAQRQIGGLSYDEALYGDDRLASNALVVGVEVADRYAGFHLPALVENRGVRNTEVGGQPVVIAYDEVTRTGIAFSRKVGGNVTTVAPVRSEGRLLLEDTTTGTLWTLEETGITGPLVAEQLQFVPSIISERYGWSAYHPETDLFADPTDAEVE
jgi:hypothetical protein